MIFYLEIADSQQKESGITYWYQLFSVISLTVLVELKYVQVIFQN